MDSIEFKSIRENEVLRLRALVELSTGERRARLEKRLAELEAAGPPFLKVDLERVLRAVN